MFQQDAFQHNAFQTGTTGDAVVTNVPNALMMMGQGLVITVFSRRLIEELDIAIKMIQ